MGTSWITPIVTSKVFAFRDGNICEACALDIQSKLSKENSSLSWSHDNVVKNLPALKQRDYKLFPQGPCLSCISDKPVHCSSGNRCLQPISLPTGMKGGCPLDIGLTQKGVEYTLHHVASHILYGSVSQKCLARLWRKLFLSEVQLPGLIQIANVVPHALALDPEIRNLTKPGAKLLPIVLTDLDFLYGAATSSFATILWRLAIHDSGKIYNLEEALIPLSESKDRSLTELLEEAVSSSAWT